MSLQDLQSKCEYMILLARYRQLLLYGFLVKITVSLWIATYQNMYTNNFGIKFLVCLHGEYQIQI